MIASEGQIVIRLQLLKTGRICADGRGERRGCISVGGIALSCTAFVLAVDKHCLVNNDLGCITFLALRILPVAGLDRARQANRGTLAEITRNEFCGLAPSNDVDEVRLGTRLRFALGREAAVDSQSEGYHRNIVLGLLQLRVCAKTAAQDDFVQIQT